MTRRKTKIPQQDNDKQYMFTCFNTHVRLLVVINDNVQLLFRKNSTISYVGLHLSLRLHKLLVGVKDYIPCQSFYEFMAVPPVAI